MRGPKKDSVRILESFPVVFSNDASQGACEDSIMPTLGLVANGLIQYFGQFLVVLCKVYAQCTHHQGCTCFHFLAYSSFPYFLL
jgi:hypothetical protein